MKIAIAGTGYVGLSNAILLAQHNEVIALDIVPKKIAMLNRKHPIEDAEIEDFFKNRKLNFKAALDKHEAYVGADYVIIASPTDYDPETNYFNTRSIESVILNVMSINPQAVMILKSTVTVGYTVKAHVCSLIATISSSRPNFCAKAVPCTTTCTHRAFSSVNVPCVPKSLPTCSSKARSSKTSLDSTEAEAIKLFANTHLAMRVAYFNELDTYAATQGLDTKGHSGSWSRSSHRRSLQQPFVWLRR